MTVTAVVPAHNGGMREGPHRRLPGAAGRHGDPVPGWRQRRPHGGQRPRHLPSASHTIRHLQSCHNLHHRHGHGHPPACAVKEMAELTEAGVSLDNLWISEHLPRGHALSPDAGRTEVLARRRTDRHHEAWHRPHLLGQGRAFGRIHVGDLRRPRPTRPTRLAEPCRASTVHWPFRWRSAGPGSAAAMAVSWGNAGRPDRRYDAADSAGGALGRRCPARAVGRHA